MFNSYLLNKILKYNLYTVGTKSFSRWNIKMPDLKIQLMKETNVQDDKNDLHRSR